MTLAVAVLLAAMPAMAQTTTVKTSSIDLDTQDRVQSLERSMRAIQSGAPTLTWQPTHRGTNTFDASAIFNRPAVWNSSVTMNGGLFGIYYSTCANLAGLTGSTLNVGISTVTPSVAGSTWGVRISGPMCDTIGCNTAAEITVAFLVGGTFVGGMSSSIGCWQGGPVGGNQAWPAAMSCDTVITTAHGAPAFTFTADTSNGAGNNVPRVESTDMIAEFCVERRG